MLKTYYRLTKPGIIYGNSITAIAGFLLGADGHINWALFLEALAGLSLVIASACVFNNYIDRDIDKKMDRTSQRAIPAGQISPAAALAYASILGVLGFLILAIFTNFLATSVASIGFVVYIGAYGYFKRRSSLGTVIGSIAGATPPAVGYLAATDHLDGAAVLLFLILVFWQMPHFYAIAIYRLKDYKSAGLPVLPVKKSVQKTKLQIFLYICGFIIVTVMLTVLGYTGFVYLLTALGLGLYWLWRSFKGFEIQDSQRWARGMFKFSLIVITALSAVLSLNNWLP